jgi:hypothetical protein
MDSAAAGSTGSGSVEYLEGLTVDYDDATYSFQVEDQKISALLHTAANGAHLVRIEFGSASTDSSCFGCRERLRCRGETCDGRYALRRWL